LLTSIISIINPSMNSMMATHRPFELRHAPKTLMLTLQRAGYHAIAPTQRIPDTVLHAIHHADDLHYLATIYARWCAVVATVALSSPAGSGGA
jgi:uncharacterized membrane protein YkvA (DUF1232 family)